MFKTLTTKLGVAATAAALFAATNAHANPIDDLKKAADEGKALKAKVEEIDRIAKGVRGSARKDIDAKREHLKNAVQGVKIFADALYAGRPFPLYLSKPAGGEIQCGDQVWLHSTANDRVLISQKRKDGYKYERVNAGFMPLDEAKKRFGGPNVTIECKSKAKGSALTYNDAFIFNLEQDKSLADGKSYLKPCAGCTVAPRVRLDTQAQIKKESAYWVFRGGSGSVRSGIPAELAATNRGNGKGVIGGYCQVGLFPVIKLEFDNHCDHKWLLAAIADQGYGKPPKWLKDQVGEVKALYAELKSDIEKAKRAPSRRK